MTVRNYSNSARAEEYYERGGRLEDNGELEAALEHYERAVAEDPAFGDAYVEMAYIQLRLGDERRAVENLRRAIRVSGHPLAYYNLGWIYEGRDRPERAEQLYRKAAAASPEMADAYLGLGAVLLNRGRLEEACAQIDRAAELDADRRYVTFLQESAVPRYREFARQLSAAGGIAGLGTKEQVYLDFGAMLLGSAGDDGLSLPTGERRDFSRPAEPAVTAGRFLEFCKHFRWRFAATAATDPGSEPLAVLLAQELGCPYWRPEHLAGSGRVLLVAASLRDTREYLAALDALEEFGCSIFTFALSLSPGCARSLDYRSLPQVLGLLTDGQPYWLTVDPDPGLGEGLAGRLAADYRDEWGGEANLAEQVSWYARLHSHLNFPLWGAGSVRR